MGDACDIDTDNDGIHDLLELAGCTPFGPTDRGVPFDARYDDDLDGNPVPPLGSDAGDDGPSPDTDGDAVLDGVECAAAFDPNNGASKPPNGPNDPLDFDGDLVPNGAEMRKWGTSQNLKDSDGDGYGDCLELTDFTGDRQVTFLEDLIPAAKAATGTSPMHKEGVFDLDADGDTDLFDILIVAKVRAGHSCTNVSAPPAGDPDQDGVSAAGDNCTNAPNPGQQATHNFIFDNGTDLPGDDFTNPTDDRTGDACDPDRDNDGLFDLTEAAGCPGFFPTDPGVVVLDRTNDDDHDGNPASPMGSDSGDDDVSWDSDGDGALDGVECRFGTDPNNESAKPSTVACKQLANARGANPSVPDSDGDGLYDDWEVCGWGTDPLVIDSDGDLVGDCKEAADISGDAAVTFLGDALPMARAVFNPSFDKNNAFDLNRDGKLDFLYDVLFMARFATVSGLCK
jgi:hypothetical protein